MNKKFEQFLESKRIKAHFYGKEIKIEPNQILFPFQRDVVKWAARKGRAAL